MNSRDGSAKQKAEQSVKNVNYAKWARTPTQTSASTKKTLPTQLTAASTLVDSTSGASPTYNVRFPPVTAQKAANSNEEEQESSRSSPERIPLIDRVMVAKNVSYGHMCSKRCQHSWLPSTTTEEHNVEESEEYIKELEQLIAKKTVQVQRLQKLYSNILSGNLRQLDAVEAEEDDIFSGADQIVTHYNKLESVARNLQKLANEEIKAAQQDYEAVKARTNEELATMEAELKACAGKVTDARESLRTLKSYKDKEHAVNQLRINKLNAEIEQLRVDNLDSLKDLKGKLCTRQLSQVRMVENMKDEARIKSVVHLIHELPDPIQEMAKENKRLVMEIERQRQIVIPLRDEMLRLQNEVRALKSSRTSIKKCMFPELFKVYEKCTPDMDVVLNIPTQKKLPV